MTDVTVEAIIKRGDEWMSRALTAEAALREVEAAVDRLARLTPANESEAEVQASFVQAIRAALVGVTAGGTD